VYKLQFITCTSRQCIRRVSIKRRVSDKRRAPNRLRVTHTNRRVSTSVCIIYLFKWLYPAWRQLYVIFIFITCKQLHKFLRNKPTKQDLINAVSKINAGDSDLLYGGVYSVIYGISWWSSVLFTIMCVRTQTFFVIRKFCLLRFSKAYQNLTGRGC